MLRLGSTGIIATQVGIPFELFEVKADFGRDDDN